MCQCAMPAGNNPVKIQQNPSVTKPIECRIHLYSIACAHPSIVHSNGKMLIVVIVSTEHTQLTMTMPHHCTDWICVARFSARNYAPYKTCVLCKNQTGFIILLWFCCNHMKKLLPQYGKPHTDTTNTRHHSTGQTLFVVRMVVWCVVHRRIYALTQLSIIIQKRNRGATVKAIRDTSLVRCVLAIATNAFVLLLCID